MWPSNLSPDDSDLGSSNLLRRTIDKSNLLSEVEAGIHVSISTSSIHLSNVLCGLGIRYTFNLDQACAWGSVALATLVAQMATPIVTTLARIPSFAPFPVAFNALIAPRLAPKVVSRGRFGV